MPVINRKSNMFPAWSSISDFDVYTAIEGKEIIINSVSPNTALFVVKGRAFVEAEGKEYIMNAFQAPSNALVLNTGSIVIRAKSASGYWMDRCTVYVFHGDWDEMQMDVFRISRRVVQQDNNKAMLMKNNYFPTQKHDYEQAWLVYKGRGITCINGKYEEVEPGDLILVKAGEEFDLIQAHTYIEGICMDLS